ncbi:MAG: hypothetical protein H6828_05895 [Planctomycetes bacterium]|nr:hypothetical protein [Planctomycetota bacterium]
MNASPLRLGLALALLGLPAAADTIYLLDGTSIDEVSITNETCQEIEYKDSSKKKTVKTDDVLRVEFTAKSALVDRADTAAAEDQLGAAIGDFTTYVEGQLSSGKKPRYEWEPAYAMHRLVELYGIVGDAQGLIGAADKLIANAPDSRHVPEAYLAKADAQFQTGDAAGAKKTLDAMHDFIQAKRLSPRWDLEQKLASALCDAKLTGKKLRDELDKVSKEAGGNFPQVKNAADVAVAESWLAEQKFNEAEPIFKRVTDQPKAGRATLAAAYTGLGDCLFKRATTKEGEERAALMTDAIEAYMRVVVVYKDQVRYVPKAMFWAGRALDDSNDELQKEKAQKLYAKVARDYAGSKWAEEARNFRKSPARPAKTGMPRAAGAPQRGAPAAARSGRALRGASRRRGLRRARRGGLPTSRGAASAPSCPRRDRARHGGARGRSAPAPANDPAGRGGPRRRGGGG